MGMTEREKVIKGLEGIYRCVSPVTYTCGDCPYQDNRVGCKRRALSDAIAMLKEQEAIKGRWIPIKSPTGVEAFGVKEMIVQDVRCSNAEEDVSFSVYKFCPRCGEKMDVKKPPLGLKPRWIHDWERMIEIIEAIERYVHAGKDIPKDWISELKELLLTNFYV